MTDQDIYRYLPTVIVSTVDKLALLGQNHRFSNLFGRIDIICGKHGASFGKSNELCDAAAAVARGERPQTCVGSGAAVRYGPFHDPAPAILVQDELHLLNEELGTFDAHYETGIIELFKSLGQSRGKSSVQQPRSRILLGRHGSYIFKVRASFLPMDQMLTIRSTTVPVPGGLGAFSWVSWVLAENTRPPSQRHCRFSTTGPESPRADCHDPAKAALSRGGI